MKRCDKALRKLFRLTVRKKEFLFEKREIEE